MDVVSHPVAHDESTDPNKSNNDGESTPPAATVTLGDTRDTDVVAAVGVAGPCCGAVAGSDSQQQRV